MRKKQTTAVKMKRAAGVFYFVLAAYQMLLQVWVIRQQVAVSNLSVAILAALLVMAGAAGMAAWLFATPKPLRPGAANVVIVATAFVILFELLSYNQQMLIIDSALYELLPSLYGNTLAQYFLLVVQMLLLIFGAFFTAGSKPQAGTEQGRLGDVRLDVVDEDGKRPDPKAVEIFHKNSKQN